MPTLKPRKPKHEKYIQHPGSRWIDEHMSTLPDHEWVAADASGLIAHDASIHELNKKLKQANVPEGSAAIAYLTTDIIA